MLNLEIARDFLEQVGIRVETALNGEEAVRICRDHREKFDLILMDIRMPVMDGLTAVRAIRALDRPDAAPEDVKKGKPRFPGELVSPCRSTGQGL